jgi:hypothetical protein
MCQSPRRAVAAYDTDTSAGDLPYFKFPPENAKTAFFGIVRIYGYEILDWGSQLHTYIPGASAYPPPHIAMRFSQHVIVMSALFSIYTSASPLPTVGIQAIGLPLPRLEPSWCGGFTQEGCTNRCESLGYKEGICETLYVNLNNFDNSQVSCY